MAAAQVSGTPAPAEAAVEAPAVAPAAPAAEDGGGEDSAEAREAAAIAELTGKALEKPETEKPKEPEKPKEEIPSIEEQSRSFAALKHKTKRFEEERQAFNAEKAKFEEERTAHKAEIDQIRSELESRREKAKKTPLEALKEIGWTPEQLLQYIGENGQVPQERIVEMLRDEMRKELDGLKEETKKERAAREAREAEQVKSQQAEQARAFERKVGLEIVDIAEQEAAKYPYVRKILLKDPGAIHREVLNRIAHAYQTTKNPLAISDAMLQIEKATAAWFDESPADPQQERVVQPTNPGSSIQPISKSDTVKRGVAPKKELDEMTEEEREELALRIAKGEVE